MNIDDCLEDAYQTVKQVSDAPIYRLALDFHPGHDSSTKLAPVEWCKTKLGIETIPGDWCYEGWGVYVTDGPILTQAQKNELWENWETKYEGRVRGAQFRS